MKKLLLIGAFSIILILAPNSIRTAYTISESSPRLDFSLEVEEFGNGTVLLKWQTQSENEISGFQIERMGNNGQYLPCGFVPAFGSGKHHKYRFVDQPNSVGMLQYRILKIGIAQPEYIHSAEQFEHKAEFIYLGMEKSENNESLNVSFQVTQAVGLTIRVLNNTYKELSATCENYQPGKHTICINKNSEALQAAQNGFLEFEYAGKRVLQEINY